MNPRAAGDYCCELCKAIEAAQTPADDEVISKIGRVTARIGPGQIGEVRLKVRGGSEDYLAITAHPGETLAENDAAFVVGQYQPRTLIVRRAPAEPVRPTPGSALRVNPGGN